jgi:hypothetical protein
VATPLLVNLPDEDGRGGCFFLETLNYSLTALFKNINSSLAIKLMSYRLGKILKDMGRV